MTPAEHNIRLLLAEMTLTDVIEQKIRQDFTERLPRDAWYVLLDAFEMAILKVATEKYGANQVKMAQVLGLNRNTLRKKLADCGLIGNTYVSDGFVEGGQGEPRQFCRDAPRN